MSGSSGQTGSEQAPAIRAAISAVSSVAAGKTRAEIGDDLAAELHAREIELPKSVTQHLAEYVVPGDGTRTHQRMFWLGMTRLLRSVVRGERQKEDVADHDVEPG